MTSKRSLKAKIVSIVLCVAAFNLLLYIVFINPITNKNIKEILVKQGQGVAHSTANAINQEISRGHPITNKVIRNLINIRQMQRLGLNFALVRDSNGEILAHTFAKIPYSRQIDSSYFSSSNTKLANLTLTVPLTEGQLVFGLNEDSMNEVAQNHQIQIFPFQILVILIGSIACLILLLIFIMTPILKVSDFARHLTENTDTKITQIHTGLDELDAIVTGFQKIRVNHDHPIRQSDRTTEHLQRVNEDLLKAKNAAERATGNKNMFLAKMSHEIRTPMNSIIGLVSLLERTELSKSQQQYISTLKTSAESLLVLIDDILDLSKIEAGKLQLQVLKFDVRYVLHQVQELLGHQIKNKGLSMNISIDKAIPKQLYGDPYRLRQILINLLSNAIKFTQTGRIDVYVVPIKGNSTGTTLRFEVKDTGSGISNDFQKTLFEPFNQQAGSLTHELEGAGLGLAISHDLVQLMGGTIGLTSETNQGSTFWFTAVFLTSATQLTPMVPAKPKSLDEIPGEKFGIRANEPDKQIILIVEDNTVNQELVTCMLEDLNFSSELAQTGATAVEKVAAHHHRYAAILLDCQLPQGDGYEVARAIRAWESGRNPIPIIAMTAHATDANKNKALHAGMNAHLTKPFNLTQLKNILDTWIEGKP